MQFDEVLAAYRRLLEANPGKCLYIGSDMVALLQDGHLVGAHLDGLGNPEVDDTFDFDAGAFDSERGCWDCDNGPSETLQHINFPQLADL